MPHAALRNWQLPTLSPGLVHTLCKSLGIQPLTANILVARGFDTPEKAYKFLNPSFDDIPAPELMKDMDRAVRRTLEAFRDNDPILVFGDSDVDGITAASCVYQFLGNLGADVSFYIPQRADGGYGLTITKVQEAIAEGRRLIITTDCGVSNVESITFARQNGVDVIVIDHHTLPAVLPPATAILNPLQEDCRFPFDRMAAVGVCYTYISGLNNALKSLGAFPNASPKLRDYLDIVALGTVADAVPLVDTNRIFVREGLKVLRKRHRPGVQALMERAQVEGRPITARTIGYRLAPLINAAGRMGDANRCVTLLTTDSYGLAISLSKELESDNARRQKAERSMIEMANTKAEEARSKGHDFLMLSSDEWHDGVLGIVASRIKEQFNLPVAMVSIDKETGRARASLRATTGVNLIAAMDKVSDKLQSYGGHTAAAGMTFDAKDLEGVHASMNQTIAAQLAQLPPHDLPIDAVSKMVEMDHIFERDLINMAPFGVMNPEPLVMVSNIRSFRRYIVNDKHLRVQFKENSNNFEVIGFGLANKASLLDQSVDMVVTPRQSLHCGKPKLELQIKTIRQHEKGGA